MATNEEIMEAFAKNAAEIIRLERELSREHAENARLTAELADVRHDLLVANALLAGADAVISN